MKPPFLSEMSGRHVGRLSVLCVVWEVVNSGGTLDSDRFRASESSAKVCEIEHADVAFTPLLRATEDPMCPRRYKKTPNENWIDC